VRKKAIAFMVGVMVLGLFAAGCGSSGVDEGEPVAKNVFVKKVNALCYDAAYRRLGPPLGELTNQVVKAKSEPQKRKLEAEYTTNVLIPIVQEELDEIRETGLPRGEEQKAEHFIEEVEKILEKIEAEPETYAHGVNLTDTSYEADKLGIHECPIG
jgi:hypothetical protein